MVSPLGVIVGLVGGVLLVVALAVRSLRVPLAASGAALVAFGLLAQRGGAPVFFAFLGAVIGLAMFLPAVIAAAREISEDSDSNSPAGAVTALLAAFLLGITAPGADAATPISPDQITQELRVEEGRVYSELELRITGSEGDTCLLMNDFLSLIHN